MIARPEEVLSFWLDEVDQSAWYTEDATLDETIRKRFLATWEEAHEGGLGLWMTYPSGALAYLIITDQLSRNMFRGSGQSFATDANARAVAKAAIARDWDLRIDPPARQFFYMPLEHSENQSDQDRAVRLISTRLTGDSNLLHARAHREVIRQFGRFPHRNAALDRATSPAEQAWIDAGGYGATVRSLQTTMETA